MALKKKKTKKKSIAKKKIAKKSKSTTDKTILDEIIRVDHAGEYGACLLYTSPSPRDATLSRMPSSA